MTRAHTEEATPRGVIPAHTEAHTEEANQEASQEHRTAQVYSEKSKISSERSRGRRPPDIAPPYPPLPQALLALLQEDDQEADRLGSLTNQDIESKAVRNLVRCPFPLKHQEAHTETTSHRNRIREERATPRTALTLLLAAPPVGSKTAAVAAG